MGKNPCLLTPITPVDVEKFGNIFLLRTLGAEIDLLTSITARYFMRKPFYGSLGALTRSQNLAGLGYKNPDNYGPLRSLIFGQFLPDTYSGYRYVRNQICGGGVCESV